MPPYAGTTTPLISRAEQGESLLRLKEAVCKGILWIRTNCANWPLSLKLLMRIMIIPLSIILGLLVGIWCVRPQPSGKRPEKDVESGNSSGCSYQEEL